jgi:hypothetical protein
MAAGKQETIAKLRKELDNVEAKYRQIIQDNAMVGEDYRSWAVHNHDIVTEKQRTIDRNDKKIEKMEALIKAQDAMIQKAVTEKEVLTMSVEDVSGRF